MDRLPSLLTRFNLCITAKAAVAAAAVKLEAWSSMVLHSVAGCAPQARHKWMVMWMGEQNSSSRRGVVARVSDAALPAAEGFAEGLSDWAAAVVPARPSTMVTWCSEMHWVQRGPSQSGDTVWGMASGAALLQIGCWGVAQVPVTHGSPVEVLGRSEMLCTM